MGVNGLWQVLQPCARPTNLATLNRKRLAVDASIWIYQFLKAVRDKEGNALRNSHVVGFFRRICKLLWFGILPVFVFDGGAPTLKRSTLQARRQRREGRREDAVRTAGKLLAVQMQRIAEEEQEKRRRRDDRKRAQTDGTNPEERGDQEDGVAEGEVLPEADKIVYAEEAHMTQKERLQSRKFTKQDAYHLPALEAGSIEGMGRPDDPRIMSIDELEDYARQFHAGEDINLYDFSKIDFDGDFFKSLPPADRYYILNAARIRSRLRMGLSKEQLDTMFPDRMAFSKFQIERVQERNHLTQRLMIEAGMTGIDLTMGPSGGGFGGTSRVAGERDREYILVKNEGAEGGWALGVVSRDKEQGQMHKPIDVDALQFRYDGDNEDGDDEADDEDMEFEDVPVEGLNRLPKLPASISRPQAAIPNIPRDDDADEDSMFVSSFQPLEPAAENRNEDGQLRDDEDEDLNRAIAMSLQNQHAQSEEEDEEMFEDVDIPAPEWKQKAVEVSRPIGGSSGQMVAHIVNNRASAAVAAAAATAKARETQQPTVTKASKADDNDDSSDSELDIRAAMAKAAKKKKQPPPVPAPAAPSYPIRPQAKNPFDGPLPFEKLDWRTSIFERKPTAPAPAPKQSKAKPKSAVEATFASSISAAAISAAKAAADAGETGELEPDTESEDDAFAGGFERPKAPKPVESEEEEEEELEGGFEKDPNAKPDAPRPLPPWMVDSTDIRTAVRQQQAYDDEINAEDREMALEEAKIWQRRQESRIVEIDSSSDDGSDLEVLEAPPPPKKKTPELQEQAPVPKEKTPEAEVAGPVTKEKTPEETQPRTKTPDEEESEDEEMVDVAVPEPEPAVKVPAVAAEEEKQEPTVPDASRRSSPDMEFEDVELPDRPARTAEPEPEEEEVAQPQTEAVPEEPVTVDGGDDDGIERREAADNDGFDFSDPDDEELMAQMAEEAEEHARFASTLNHKSEHENQMAYEQELKALRSQQKKDRRDADEVTQIMVSECQALLRLFGIPYITAPMEAEAQCAELVSLGLVDGIVTDDSDTFLFGGTRVYKNMFNGNKFVECYLSSDLEKEMSLSREQLISIAQLLGSDYTDGLPGVGPVTAVEILSEFPDGLQEFRDWWQEVQAHPNQTGNNAGSAFRRKFRKSQGTKLFLPTDFPSDAVVDAYLHPEVDRSTEPFQWGVPDLGGLRSFLMSTIGWSQERTDEVLVPVIRDMNRREMEGTQSNITRFFSGSVGTGARQSTHHHNHQNKGLLQQKMPVHIPEEYAPRHAPRNKGTASSRRMAAAVSKLKATAGATTEGGEPASADASTDANVEANGDATAAATTTTAGRKRKARGRASAPAGEEDAEADEPDNGRSSQEVEDDKEYGETTHRRTTKKKAAKKSKAS